MFADGDAVLSEAEVVAAFVRDDGARDELFVAVSRAVVLDDAAGAFESPAEMDRRAGPDDDGDCTDGDDTDGDCTASSNDGNVVQSGRLDRDCRAAPVDDSLAEVVLFDDSRDDAGGEEPVRFDGSGRSR